MSTQSVTNSVTPPSFFSAERVNQNVEQMSAKEKVATVSATVFSALAVAAAVTLTVLGFVAFPIGVAAAGAAALIGLGVLGYQLLKTPVMPAAPIQLPGDVVLRLEAAPIQLPGATAPQLLLEAAPTRLEKAREAAGQFVSDTYNSTALRTTLGLAATGAAVYGFTQATSPQALQAAGQALTSMANAAAPVVEKAMNSVIAAGHVSADAVVPVLEKGKERAIAAGTKLANAAAPYVQKGMDLAAKATASVINYFTKK